MTSKSLLQHFAINKNGVTVAVSEVARGLACECYCAACKQVMVARQGVVRAWHFSHLHEARCEYAAETALHKAAKECIQQALRLTVPGYQITETVTLPDGRSASASAQQESKEPVFDSVMLEVAHGDIRPDVVAYYGGAPLFIEIAVNHFVDELKREKLVSMGIPTIEITLDIMRHEEWNWKKLQEAVVASLEFKHWLVYPAEAALRAEAHNKAIALALTFPPPKTPSQAIKQYFKIGNATLHIYYSDTALVVWKRGVIRDVQFHGLIRIMKRLGGIWRAEKNNWRLPRSVDKPLLIALKKLRTL